MKGRVVVRRVRLGVIAAGAAAAWAAAGLSLAAVERGQAQAPRREPKVLIRVAPSPTDQERVRHELAVMEGVLAQKVAGAARGLSRRIQAAGPEMFLLGGAARARGFRLDGYGYFFDVEVPTFSRTLSWTLQMVGPPDQALGRIQTYVQSISNQRDKQELELALDQLRLQLPVVTAGQPGKDSENMIDPDEAYTREVTTALMDAMLDYSGPLGVPRDEWLSVAARDADASRLAPDENYEIVTVVLRIKGADLASFREGKLSRDEARKRVEVKEF